MEHRWDTLYRLIAMVGSLVGLPLGVWYLVKLLIEQIAATYWSGSPCHRIRDRPSRAGGDLLEAYLVAGGIADRLRSLRPFRSPPQVERENHIDFLREALAPICEGFVKHPGRQ